MIDTHLCLLRDAPAAGFHGFTNVPGTPFIHPLDAPISPISIVYPRQYSDEATMW